MINTIKKNRLELSGIFLGVLSAVNIHIGVTLIFLEILAVIYTAFRLNIELRKMHPKLFNFMIAVLLFGLLHIIVQIFTDLYVGAELLESVKSVASIVALVCLIFSGISWAIESELRLKSFLTGYVFSSLLSFSIFKDEYISADSWKFLFGNIFTIVILLLLGMSKRRNFFKIVVIVLLSCIHLFLGSRSTALFTLLTLVIFFKPPYRKSGNRSLIFAVIAIIVVLIFSEQIYRSMSLSGKLGVAQQEKARKQFESGPFLFFARSELLYELGAIKENPFIGKGSNPNLSQTLFDKITLNQQLLGLQVKETAAYQSFTLSGKIPLHSMLFSSWVEVGILGVLFWLVLLRFYIGWFPIIYNSSSTFGLLANYFLFASLWSLFFSPLGAGSRLFIALGIACCAKVLTPESGDNNVQK